MQNLPLISTKRLTLRPLLKSDISKIVEYAGNEAIYKTTINIPRPYFEKDAKWWINLNKYGFKNKTHFTFAIELTTSKSFIGTIGFNVTKQFNKAEIGYWIGEPHWNNGYCSEALNAIMQFGFTELKLNKLYATHIISNPASGKVMQKCGMIKEAELKDHFLKNEKYLDVIQYRLTKQEHSQIK